MPACLPACPDRPSPDRPHPPSDQTVRQPRHIVLGRVRAGPRGRAVQARVVLDDPALPPRSPTVKRDDRQQVVVDAVRRRRRVPVLAVHGEQHPTLEKGHRVGHVRHHAKVLVRAVG